AISSVVLLIGLAVGVDYSLFYIRREREERKAGRSKDAALEAAAATSGRAVLVSGLTVMVAMAGMYLTGNSTFASFGPGTNLAITKTIKRIERPFPGGPIPALVVVQAKDVASPAVAEGIHQMELRALATGYTQEPINVRVNPSRTVAEVLVPLAGSGTDSNSNQALRLLRRDVIPLTI